MDLGRARRLWLVVVLCLACTPPALAASDAASLRRTIDALETAWQARDAAAYLALWRFPDDASREQEAGFAREAFAAGQALLEIPRPEEIPARGPVALPAILALVSEPRGRLEAHRFAFESTAEGWKIVGRFRDARIDGLLHLSLDPIGFKAGGLSLQVEDLVLTFDKGTLFMSPKEVGPTLLTFVGEGTVRVSPRPRVEQEELQRFAGARQLVDQVKHAFVRIHPANLHQMLHPVRLDPDPSAPERLEEARRFYDAHVSQSFRLDAPLPGSPWWVLPGLGDASVTFETRHHGTLTYAVDRADPESLSLFDRARQLQICSYPDAGHDLHYDEDAGRSVDVLHHDISVRFDPDDDRLEASDELRLRLLRPAKALTLQLADALRVRSVTSGDGRALLFFRVPQQSSILVSLDPAVAVGDETTLRVAYGGRFVPPPVEREALQIFGAAPGTPERPLLERVLVYSGRSGWYPSPSNDYATASLRVDVPEGYAAVSGGASLDTQTAAGRTVFRYRQDRPGRYIGLALGKLRLVARREGDPGLSAWATSRLEGRAQQTLERVEDILRFYREEFGLMPYPSLTLALMEGPVPGGHSPPGLVLLQERPAVLRGRLRPDPASFHDVPGFFLAHELAHQWWGHGISGENYHDRWLSEGLAQYAAALWTRHAYGEDRFRDVLGRFERWARRMADDGPISLGPRLGRIRGDPQVFRAVVYDKGAYVLHMLRGLVGAQAFRSALTGLQEQHRFEKIGTADLQAALEKASGLKLGAYFDAWVYGSDLVELDWRKRTRRADGGYRTEVRVRARHVPGPLPLEISFESNGERQSHVARLDADGGRFVFETQDKARDLEVNADGGLLAIVRER